MARFWVSVVITFYSIVALHFGAFFVGVLGAFLPLAYYIFSSLTQLTENYFRCYLYASNVVLARVCVWLCLFILNPY